MSSSNYGIPVNMGLTHGFQPNGSIGLLANAMPDKVLFQFGRPITINSIEELDSFTQIHKNDLYPGYGVYVLDSDSQVKGLQKAQYMYDKYKFIDIGTPACTSYLNIINISDIPENSSNIKEWFPDFFMRVQVNKVQGNINLRSILNKQYIINNNELMVFASMVGNYSLDNTITNNIIDRMLSINITGGIRSLMKKLGTKYKVSIPIFTDFSNCIIKSVIDIISGTAYSFTLMKNDYDLDVSTYINYIASCFAAFKYIYINNGVTNSLQYSEPLRIIDSTLLTKIKSNSSIAYDFDNIRNAIQEIIYYNKSSGYSVDFFDQLEEVVNYFKENNPTIFESTYNSNKFYIDLCEGIGGIVGLALLFAIMSNSKSELSKCSLFLCYLFPEQYKNIW